MTNNNPSQIETSEIRLNIITGLGTGLVIGLPMGWVENNLLLGAAIGLSFGAVLALVLQRRMGAMRMRPAEFRRLIFSLGLFGGLWGITMLLPDLIGDRWNKFILLLPLAAGAFMVYAVGKAISTLDEMQRRLQTEAIAIGFGLSFLFILIYGTAGVLFDLPQYNWLFASVSMPFCWAIGKIAMLIRYRE